MIDAEARDALLAHVAQMRERGWPVFELPLPDECARGTFVAPTMIELPSASTRSRELTREVFGPVLHVVRWQRDELPALIDAINATGYGLTHGIHTRIDETVAAILARIRAGNVYVNRNIIGAVVGVQPFGGHGLSGTGPKAGGPLYVRAARARRRAPADAGRPDRASRPDRRIEHARVPSARRGRLHRRRRGVAGRAGAAARAAGNTALWLRSPLTFAARDRLDGAMRRVRRRARSLRRSTRCCSTMPPERAREVRAKLAAAAGRDRAGDRARRDGAYDPARLVSRADGDGQHGGGRRQRGAAVAVRGPRVDRAQRGSLPPMRYFDAATIRAALPWPRMLEALGAMLREPVVAPLRDNAHDRRARRPGRDAPADAGVAHRASGSASSSSPCFRATASAARAR